MSIFTAIGNFFSNMLASMVKCSRYQNMSSTELAEVTSEAFENYHHSLRFLKDAKSLPEEKQKDFIQKGIEFIEYDRKKISEIFMYSCLPPVGRIKILNAMDTKLNFRALETELGIAPIS